MKSLHHPSRYPAILKTLQIDCASCSGLCCVALWFSKRDGFPMDKAEGVPCVHLNAHYACDIHHELAKKQLKGCMTYDCFGAGMLATKLFSASWKEMPHDRRVIFTAFQTLYRLQEMLGYLLEASTLSDDAEIDTLILENQRYIENVQQVTQITIDKYQNRVNRILKNVCSQIGCLRPHSEALMGKNYQGCDLSFHDFSMSLLIGSTFRHTKLYGANFIGADLRDADFRDTDLRDCLFLTQRQINCAKGNRNTLLPSHIHMPAAWK